MKEVLPTRGQATRVEMVQGDTLRAIADRHGGLSVQGRPGSRLGRSSGPASAPMAARTKLARYAVTHARSQLRKSGIQPPADHETLLAEYLADGRPG